MNGLILSLQDKLRKAPSRQQLWTNFLKRTKLNESLDLETVVGLISEVLKPNNTI